MNFDPHRDRYCWRKTFFFSKFFSDRLEFFCFKIATKCICLILRCPFCWCFSSPGPFGVRFGDFRKNLRTERGAGPFGASGGREIEAVWKVRPQKK